MERVGGTLDGLRLIVVEGPIGVGKTTLARRLAGALGGEVVEEAPAENAFLPRFYENPRAWAFPAQLSFLIQRVGQLARLREPDLFTTRRVADFMLEKDRLFARLNLTPEELALYEQVYARVVEAGPEPDLVIYLHAPVAVLRERIAARGRPYERSVETAYLERLAGAYAEYFAAYDRAPVLVVDAASLDFARRDDHLQRLLDRLPRLAPGRQFLDDLLF